MMARTDHPAIKIRIETPLGTPLGRLMNDIRPRVASEKRELTHFIRIVGTLGFGHEIGFRGEEDANRFRQWFVPPT